MPKKAAQARPRAHYIPHARRPKVFDGPSLTKTDQARDANVNNIVARYDRTGVLNHLAAAEGVYADVSELGSYQDAVNAVQGAQQQFLQLPSQLRARFDNDPAKFVDWSTSATAEDRHQLYAEITGVRTKDPVEPAPGTTSNDSSNTTSTE